METSYSKYIDKNTLVIMNAISSPDIESDEKKAIITAFITELQNHIAAPNTLDKCEHIIADVSVKYIDNKITEIITNPNYTRKDIDKGIPFCKRQVDLFDVFAKNKWSLPVLKQPNIYDCVKVLETKRESLNICDEMIDLDKKISSECYMAQRNLSVETCNSALSLLGELEELIKISKQRNLNIPTLSNNDISKSTKKIEEIKKNAVQKDEMYSKMYEIDTQIRQLDSREKQGSEDCKKIIDLCKQQNENIAKCNTIHWPLPSLYFGNPTAISEKYKLFMDMFDLDLEMTGLVRSSTDSDKKYKRFQECCEQQQINLDLCRKNNWILPELVNRDPKSLLVDVQAKRAKKEVIRKRKVKLISVGVIVLIVLVLSLIGFLKYIEGKKTSPFSSTDVVGMNYSTVKEDLSRLGFSHIKTNEVETGWQKDNEVVSISIGQTTHFPRGKYFDLNENIIIYFSKPGRIDVTAILKDFENQNYSDLETALKSAGIQKITPVKVSTFEKTNDQKVTGIKINGVQYTGGSCYILKKASVEVSYYSLRVKITDVNDGYIGKNYLQVKKGLEDAGYTNVTTEKVSTGFQEPGAVVEVLVSNSHRYKKGDDFDPDIKITIRYSSDERTEVTTCLTDWKSQNYTTLQSCLKKAGFTKISLSTTPAKSKSQNNIVSSVTLNGSQYTSGKCFIPLNANINIEYFTFNVSPGKTDSGFKKKPYTEVVAELEKRGFSKITLYRSDDLVNGWVNKPGTVKSITINGRTDFKADELFRCDVKIEIVVNTFKGKDYPEIKLIAK